MIEYLWMFFNKEFYFIMNQYLILYGIYWNGKNRSGKNKTNWIRTELN